MNLITRRTLLKLASLGTSATALGTFTGCEKPESTAPLAKSAGGVKPVYPNEEYVWLSAAANLPLFTAHDHPALRLAGEELGVKVSIAGPSAVDIPGLVAAVEQTTARKPAGMMVVGWDPSALVPAINAAVAVGIPVVCVDADVPASKRLSFIGTDWFEIGVRQAEAMVKALAGRKGEVALLGLIEQEIDQKAFAGFRSIAEKVGLTCMEPQQDKGNTAEATRVAAGIIQGADDLVGMAGFDSESGPGMAQAIKEAGKTGQILATCVEAQEAHLRFLKEGVLTACVGQKRALFTYLGVQALFDLNHSPIQFTKNDKAAGVFPIASNYNTGTYTITRENVDHFLPA
ncbi:MAG: substrate-binding domain-containing protein [Verrucomicrobiales bacterium]|nr:substrate-binding domain-containing protein [Verrucomicrobiales bacterium]